MAEKIDSEENSDAEGERSDEDSDVVEQEEEERKDVGKQNSNDPTNLPCDRKCSSGGFQGCDAKCQVDDLTPYQVGNHILKCQYLTKKIPPEQQEMHGGILLCQMQVQVNLN